MKDYLEGDMAAIDGDFLAAHSWNEAGPMDRKERKIFRRKAARRAEEASLLTEPKSYGLPAMLPDAWERLPRVKPGAAAVGVRPSPLVNLFRGSGTSRSFDLLRTRLMATLRSQGWRRVAIAAPTSGCGATFTAVNLAQSLARVPGTRTVLMDMNRRAPGIASALDIHGQGHMDAFLAGTCSPMDHLVRCGEGLALGLADTVDANAAETFHDPLAIRALDEMMLTFDPDVVLYDLPAVLEHDDVAAFLPQVDGVLLVADGTVTTAAQVRACEEILGEQAELLGVILNRTRSSD
ncbi:CpsD/CapB family tyrosine-protein kinase [Pseudodonghicola xiamenensis]|uniref:CobQ/CobB/MinD/ParA nucleotide binding domain-containing protein n=1 Tax=Pseudodonghicola xiamenensis TaxID=337702 RepID=A0A8J3H9V8_9RHOB|nr:CpsD/CapB family tyrosine-protein kinase [Pseudodonghicola xiamenensis]GHG93670.1 hypothetical protein GCM10010961_26300 [Pseudodonghicola xiamenensis]